MHWIIYSKHDCNQFLQKAHVGQQMLSGDRYLTLYKAIPALEHLQSEWEAPQDNYLCEDLMYHILQARLDKLAIYYLKMESTDAHGNAMNSHFVLGIELTLTYSHFWYTVFTLYFKMVYLEAWWEEKSAMDLTKSLATEAREAFIKSMLFYFTIFLI